jgi:group I intron endonuclease
MTYHKTREDIITAFRAVHGNNYDYSCFQYVNYDTKGKIICSKHGEFFQTPGNHIRGTNCPKCSLENKKIGTFKKLCKEKGVDYYRALKRRQVGLPPEKIFNIEYIRNIRAVNEITVFGKKYPNIEEAIRVLHPPASSRTIIRWINKGIPIDEAFGKVPNPGYADGIIYLITNKITNKRYVGLTIQSLERRWQYHLEQAYGGYIKSDKSLHNSIRKHGPESFEICIIDRGKTKGDLEQKERYWIKELDTIIPQGYNISPGGVSGGSNKRPKVIDNIRFNSIKDAVDYVAETKGISLHAAKRRVLKNRIHIKGHAKAGESLIKGKPYKAWSNIVHCATNIKSKDFIPGLQVDERWRDFTNFYNDVGNPPNQEMIFARLDKTKGFFPDNCTWMTKSQASKINVLYMKEKGILSDKFILGPTESKSQ